MINKDKLVNKKYNAICLLINVIIILLEIVGFTIAIKNNGASAFIYYTIDSNFMLLISSLFITYYSYMIIAKKKVNIPKWFSVLRYISVLSVLVTFMVVLFVLAPQFGFKDMVIVNSFFAHHLFCPILGVVSFIFFEKYDFSNKDSLRALYFTFLYAIVLTTLNIFKVVKGPYPFLEVYDQSILVSLLWFVGIVGGALAFSYVVKFLNKKFCIVK